MANTFFGFNTTLNDNAERLGSSPEDIEGLEAEEEYDALNDETFGALENEDDLDDWETQHEQLAEIAESSRHSNNIESFLDNLDLNEKDSILPKDNSVWAYNEVRNGEKLSENKSNLDSTSLALLSNSRSQTSTPLQQSVSVDNNRLQNVQQPLPTKVRTVEELERMLLTQAVKPNVPPQQHPQQHYHHPYHQQQFQPPPRYPPGFPPPMVLPPGPPPPAFWHPNHHQMPPGFVRLMNHTAPTPPGVRMPPHPFVYGPHHHHGVHHQGFTHMNGPPPPPPTMVPPPHFGAFQNANRGGGGPGGQQRPRHHQDVPKDEYAGLMNNREKQWLLNIQLLQVNTGTPYFDDYYYSVFKERQAKNKENIAEQKNNQQHRYQNNRYQQQQQQNRDGHHHHHQHHHHHRQDNRQQDATQNPLNKKVYTPLQFENSLGKLQFGSVTAPRKIIDMDIITMEKDTELTNSCRDTRKTKQLLLELETLYTLLLKAEDLKNPVAIANTEKLMELKQKQRLREMDAAPTPEQKQEILKLLQQESVPCVETQADLLGRIVTIMLQDDKLTSFLGIRKGKMLLLRFVPHLITDTYGPQLNELWTKFLLSIPLIGRRDAVGDNILPRFHWHFKRFATIMSMEQILELFRCLSECIKLESNSRSTPLSYQSKSPLHFVLSNKCGISIVSTLLRRVDALLASSSDNTSEWPEILTGIADTISRLTAASISVPAPIEPVPDSALNEMAQHLATEKRVLLLTTFADNANQ